MKRNSSLRWLALFGAFVIPTSLQALEVHEWGTFTVLVGSNGSMANWYQPYSDIAQLPGFTDNPMAMKRGINVAKVRMETPVIYFYPQEETNIKVNVLFRDGQITERFPAAMADPYDAFNRRNAYEPGVITSHYTFNTRYNEISERARPIVTHWSGKLLPPSHADAKLIPSVAGHKGENYGAAREVPDAWIFRSDGPVIKTENQPDIHPVEKFIFYRGAGQSVPPYSVSMSDEQTMTFSNFSSSESGFQVALRVRNGKASWKQMPSLPDPKVNADRSTSITFPEETISIDQAEEELGALFLTQLTSRGLTPDEAKAMINTWNHTWFTEPGQRVFTIVDRAWVEDSLPLAISPEPKKIERVFVARYEVLSPETEQKIATLMSEDTQSDHAVIDFKALQLGRFANGAVELVAEQAKQKVLGNYSQLQIIANQPEKP